MWHDFSALVVELDTIRSLRFPGKVFAKRLRVEGMFQDPTGCTACDEGSRTEGLMLSLKYLGQGIGRRVVVLAGSK